MTTGNEFFGGGDLRPGDPGPNESLASASRSAVGRPSLLGLLRAGARALRRFPGLLFGLYVLQLALSAGAALVLMAVFARTFGNRPLFDRAMDGDLAALVTCFADPAGRSALFGAVVICAAAVLVYGVVSWMLTAGLIAVLLDAPSRRREVVRWFGAAGASNFFPFLRLSLWSLLPHAAVGVAAAFGLRWIRWRLDHALEPDDLLTALAIGLSPALVLHWLLAASIDYARIDLVRHPGMSSVRALARGFGLIGRRRITLVHTLLYGAVFGGVFALQLWLTGSGAVSGMAGLIVVRQIAGLTRFAAHVGLIAGQVELACATMGTPLGRQR